MHRRCSYSLGHSLLLQDWQTRSGPNLSLNYIKKVTPVMPTLVSVAAQMVKHFSVPYRSAVHTVPDAQKDILALVHRYRRANVMENTPKRRLDLPKDCEGAGMELLRAGKVLTDWRIEREMLRSHYSTAERSAGERPDPLSDLAQALQQVDTE